jgi:hypothetical protein
MTASTVRHYPHVYDELDDALRGAREALERLRATLCQSPLAEADPSRQPTEPAPGLARLRVRR